MIDKILDLIGAEVFQPGPQLSLNSIENELQARLPKVLVSILTEMGGGIIFSAKYKPHVTSPVTDLDGFQSLDFLYGLTDGDNGILSKNRNYSREQIPDTHFTVGESSAGNQICIEKNSGKIYYWYHEAVSEDAMFFLIADDFDEFLAKLEPDESTDEDIFGEVEISNLDF